MTSPGPGMNFDHQSFGERVDRFPQGFLGCLSLFQVCGEPAKITEVVFHSHFSHFFFCVQLDAWGKNQFRQVF